MANVKVPRTVFDCLGIIALTINLLKYPCEVEAAFSKVHRSNWLENLKLAVRFC